MLPCPLGPTAAWWGWGVRPTWELIAILGEPWGVRGDHRQTKKPEAGQDWRQEAFPGLASDQPLYPAQQQMGTPPPELSPSDSAGMGTT